MTHAPVPLASPQAKTRAVHRALAICGLTHFYVWPSRSSAPTVASYPPATTGDAFHVVGPAALSLTGLSLYETTIAVLHPYGSGTHYWVLERCVNVL